MKKLKHLLCFSLFTFHYSLSFAQSWDWGAAGYGALKSDLGGAMVATDKNGNAYITGHFENQIVFAPDTLFGGSDNFFLTKYNSAGNVIWAVKANDSANSYSEGTAITTDKWGNILITGDFYGVVSFGTTTLRTYDSTTSSAVFIVKYTPSGHVLWAKQSTSASLISNGWSHGVAADNVGNAYITGEFSDTLSFGIYKAQEVGNYCSYLVKYDSAGTVLWVRQSEINGLSGGKAVNVDNIGNVYITGEFFDSVAFGAYTLRCAYGVFNAFIAKYSSSGNVLWAKQTIGGVLSDYAFSGSVTTDLANNVYMAGYFQDSVYFGSRLIVTSNIAAFLTKYDAVGNVTWVKQSASGCQSGSITSDKKNNIYMTGSDPIDTFRFGNFKMYTHPWSGAGAFVIKLDTSGNAICGSLLNNLSTDYPYITSDSSSDYTYIGGLLFEDTVICALDTLLPPHPFASFLARWQTCTGEGQGIDGLKTPNKTLTVYPNPFTNTTTIALNTQYSLPNTYYLELDDLTGRKLRWIEFTGTQYQLQANDLAKGIYFIRAYDSDMNVIGTIKIVVQ